MRTARTIAGSVLTLSLLAVPCGTAGQSSDELPADGNEDAAPVHVTWTGAYGWSFPVDQPDEVFPWGIREHTGWHLSSYTSDDPRISGEVTYLGATDSPSSPEAGDLARETQLMRIENELGAWQGPVTVVVFPDYLQVSYGWLKGEGAYEGLYYFTSYYDDTASDIHKGQGVIWPGEPPPVPDASLLAAELDR